MKKQTLVLGIMALALLFVFVGCSNDATFTVEQGTKIPGPSGLRGEALVGANLLTWDPVIDAKGYAVFRKDDVTKATVHLKDVSYGELYYIDVVDWDNQLVHERRYIYTVASLNQNGINRSSVEVPVFNGSSTVNVTANIPAIADFEPALKVEDIEVFKNENYAFVKIVNDKSLSYTVEYTIGTTTLVRVINPLIDASNTSNFGEWFDPYIVVRFPLFGGKNQFIVSAQFVGGTNYYTATKEEAVDADLALDIDLDAPAWVYADFVPNELGSIRVAWDEVEGAKTYSVYRAELLSASTTSSNVLLSDWTIVGASQNYQAEMEIYWLTDTVTDSSTAYLYAVVARDGDKASKPTLSDPFDFGGFGGNPNLSLHASGGYNVTVRFDAEEGVTYTLAYAKASNAEKDRELDIFSFYTLTSAWTPVTLEATDIVLGDGIKEVTLDEGGTGYIFRLTASAGGFTQDYFEVLTGYPFNERIYFDLYKVSQSFTNQIADTITLGIYFGNTYYGRDYIIDVYRRNSYSSGHWEQISPAAGVPYNQGESWSYIDEGLDVSVAYDYTIRVRDYQFNYGHAGNTLFNVRPYGYYYSVPELYSADVPVAAATPNFFEFEVITDGTQPTAAALTLPARGMVVSGATFITSTGEEIGTGITGLKFTIEYYNNAATPERETAEVEVRQISWAEQSGTGADITERRIQYRYWFPLPTNANLDSNTIELIWYASGNFGGTTPVLLRAW